MPVMLDPPSLPMIDRIALFYGAGDRQWHCDVKTTRGDLFSVQIKGPNDEQTYKAFVGVVRASVMALNVLGAAIDDAAKDTAE